MLIASMKIVAGLVAPVVFAILLNEVRNSTFKRFSQTLVYLPHFLSWVVLGGILLDMLSPEGGLVNQVAAGIARQALRLTAFLPDEPYRRMLPPDAPDSTLVSGHTA